MEDAKGSFESDTAKVALEFYKTAFSRLTFQDEYLFKFSTVFLTAHGALALLARSAFSEKTAPVYGVLAIASVIGLILAWVWALWIKHNDFWHSVWIGVLIRIEQTHFRDVTPVFAAKHEDLAKRDRTPPSRVGHKIAQLIPIGVGFAWGVVLLVAVCQAWPAVQPTLQGDVSASGGAAP